MHLLHIYIVINYLPYPILTQFKFLIGMRMKIDFHKRNKVGMSVISLKPTFLSSINKLKQNIKNINDFITKCIDSKRLYHSICQNPSNFHISTHQIKCNLRRW